MAMDGLNASVKTVPARWLMHVICVLSLGMSSCLCGCGAGPVWTRDDPRDVLAGFLQTTEAQNVEGMWEFLSAETRSALDARADAFNANTDNGAKRRGCDMLRAGHVLSTTREYKKLEIASQNDNSATVEIILHDGAKIPVTMHRDGNRWAIELPVQ